MYMCACTQRGLYNCEQMQSLSCESPWLGRGCCVFVDRCISHFFTFLSVIAVAYLPKPFSKQWVVALCCAGNDTMPFVASPLCSSPLQLSLSDGQYTFGVTATDKVRQETKGADMQIGMRVLMLLCMCNSVFMRETEMACKREDCNK